MSNLSLTSGVTYPYRNLKPCTAKTQTSEPLPPLIYTSRPEIYPLLLHPKQHNFPSPIPAGAQLVTYFSANGFSQSTVSNSPRTLDRGARICSPGWAESVMARYTGRVGAGLRLWVELTGLEAALLTLWYSQCEIVRSACDELAALGFREPYSGI